MNNSVLALKTLYLFPTGTYNKNNHSMNTINSYNYNKNNKIVLIGRNKNK